MTTRANRSRGMPRRTVATPVPSSRLPLVVGGAILALVAVAAVVAIALSGPTTGGRAEPARAAVGITGEALAPFTDPATDSAVGSVLPTLSGVDLAGEPLTIGPGDGPMAIVVLAHWCGYCQAEVPVITDYLRTQGMPDGVDLVALTTSIDPARPNYPPSAWLEREAWTSPTLVDDASSRALAALGLASFPGFIFVDGDGRVAERWTGALGAEGFAEAVAAIAP